MARQFSRRTIAGVYVSIHGEKIFSQPQRVSILILILLKGHGGSCIPFETVDQAVNLALNTFCPDAGLSMAGVDIHIQ